MPFNKKKDNPHVSIETCNMRHEGINSKFDGLNNNILEIIKTLKGTGEVDNLGLLGEIRDIKRDRRWTYALITMLGVPIIFLIINYLMRG